MPYNTVPYLDSHVFCVSDVYLSPLAFRTPFCKDVQLSNSNHFDVQLGEALTRRYQLGDLLNRCRSRRKSYQEHVTLTASQCVHSSSRAFSESPAHYRSHNCTAGAGPVFLLWYKTHPLFPFRYYSPFKPLYLTTWSHLTPFCSVSFFWVAVDLLLYNSISTAIWRDNLADNSLVAELAWSIQTDVNLPQYIVTYQTACNKLLSDQVVWFQKVLTCSYKFLLELQKWFMSLLVRTQNRHFSTKLGTIQLLQVGH